MDNKKSQIKAKRNDNKIGQLFYLFVRITLKIGQNPFHTV